MSYQPNTALVGDTDCTWGQVRTEYKDGCFRSTIKYANSTGETNQFYSDLGSAQEGHREWVIHLNELIGPKELSKKKNEPINISLLILMKILYEHIGENSITTRLDRIESNLMKIKVDKGNFTGECVYDLSNGKIINISDLWRVLLEQYRTEYEKKSRPTETIFI